MAYFNDGWMCYKNWGPSFQRDHLMALERQEKQTYLREFVTSIGTLCTQ